MVTIITCGFAPNILIFCLKCSIVSTFRSDLGTGVMLDHLIYQGPTREN